MSIDDHALTRREFLGRGAPHPESDRWSGFGALSGTDIQEGMEQARKEGNEGMAASIERMGEQRSVSTTSSSRTILPASRRPERFSNPTPTNCGVSRRLYCAKR